MLDMEMLYSTYGEQIYRYLLRICGNGLLAEELTQETFFRAYMNLKKLRKSEAVSSWLYRIAKNTYFTWYEEQKRLFPLEEACVAEECDFRDQFSDRAIAEQAFRCLHSLREPYKEVFLLAVFAELPLKEISKLFGKGESWARVTLLRAKKQILKRMEEGI
ncbi:MAG: RNA polymerase sigma factor [Ruminococcaceae bacterium]|nr:RNA polymerase sigma factor [Oscillospiraceae bacterium]